MRPETRSEFIALGTGAGGVPDPDRCQPCHLVSFGGQAVLVDAGCGVTRQLARIGVMPTDIDTVLLSHLHFDHTGGLFGFLGLRYQVPCPREVTVYGPPGTKALIDGLVAAMQPGHDFMVALQPARKAPETGVRVVEIGSGQRLVLGEISVSGVANSHYGFPAGSDEADRFLSLSFRFDFPDRSIGFTGDTGPSADVELLLDGVDLLVSEVIEPEAALAFVQKARSDLPASTLSRLRHHFKEHHLVPEQVGRMARQVRAKELVLVHNGLFGVDDGPTRSGIEAIFEGNVTFAKDLDRF